MPLNGAPIPERDQRIRLRMSASTKPIDRDGETCPHLASSTPRAFAERPQRWIGRPRQAGDLRALFSPRIERELWEG